MGGGFVDTFHRHYPFPFSTASKLFLEGSWGAALRTQKANISESGAEVLIPYVGPTVTHSLTPTNTVT